MDKRLRCPVRHPEYGHRCIRRLHHDKSVVKGGKGQVRTPHRAFAKEWS